MSAARGLAWQLTTEFSTESSPGVLQSAIAVTPPVEQLSVAHDFDDLNYPAPVRADPRGRLRSTEPEMSKIKNIQALSPIIPNINNYKADSRRPPARSTGPGADRISYADLSLLFRDKFLRNYLYINSDDTDGVNLTTYNITLFTLPESEVLGAAINNVAIKGLSEYPQAIIITQSAGTDEFYLENLEFTHAIGKAPDRGTGTPPREVSFTIKAPTNNDFIDQLMKAAIVGEWKSHMEMPLFMHIEWKGRSTTTDAPITQVNNEFRCFPLKITSTGGATLNEGGSTYTLGCTGYSNQTFNNNIGRIQEDGSIRGKTVGELLAKLTVEMYKSETKGKDNSLFPDEVYIDFPEKTGSGTNKIFSYKMVTSKAKEFSNLASQKNPNSSASASSTTSDFNKNVTTAPLSSDSSSSAKSRYVPEITMSSSEVTFHLKSGMSVKDIIIKIISHTKEAQQYISAIPDAQDSEAMKKKKDVPPSSYMREFISISSDVQLKAWDPMRRKYAAKHFIKIFEYESPSYSESEQVTTQQGKGASTARLFGMLDNDFIRKCYHHIHTGLNTEIKSLDWNFDNTLFMASNLFSGVVSSYQQRQHGIQLGKADDGTSHLGFADAALNNKRVIDEARRESAQAVKTAEKFLKEAIKPRYDEDGNLMVGDVGAEMSLAKAKKEHEAKVKELRDKTLIAYLQGSADVVKGSITEQFASFEVSGNKNKFLKGLGPNQQAFMMGDGRIKVISWKSASLDVAIDPKPGGTMLSDVDDKIVMKSINSGAMFPVQFASTRMAETEQGGIRKDHDKGKNVFAEIYQNHNIEMMKISMVIRGDPYWIPNIGQMLYMSGADVHQNEVGLRDKIVQQRQDTARATNPNFSVSPSTKEAYCIIVADQANTYDPETGVMEIKERNSLNGVYLITQVKSQFSGGEFTQELELVRSVSIDLNSIFGGYNLADAARVNKKLQDDTGGIVTVAAQHANITRKDGGDDETFGE